MEYPDSVTISRPGVPTGPKDEFGKQTEPAPTTLYDDDGDIQDAPLSIAVQLAGDEDLMSLARIFLLERTDIRAMQIGDDVSVTYGSTGRTVTGKVLKLDPFSESVYVKWQS